MPKKPTAPAPAGLGTDGKALWKSIMGDLAQGWELDARELHLLTQACRCEDDLVTLQAAVKKDGHTIAGSREQTTVHPALSEARQLRLVQRRLLDGLEMVDPKSLRSSGPASEHARKAADTRWQLERSRRGQAG